MAAGWAGGCGGPLYLQWGQNASGSVALGLRRRADVGSREVTRAQVPPGPYVTVPFEDKGLKPHTAYYYRVRAVDKAGRAGEPSDVCCGVTREPPEG
jgi:hypothetical protein